MNIRTNLQVGLNTFVVGALRINGSVQGKMVVSCDAMEYHEMGYIYCVYIVYNSVYIYMYIYALPLCPNSMSQKIIPSFLGNPGAMRVSPHASSTLSASLASTGEVTWRFQRSLFRVSGDPGWVKFVYHFQVSNCSIITPIWP